MPKPRKRLVSLQDTPYYHCISRCVRRAFLCGVDSRTGFDFSHRRAWIVERMQHLSQVFAIDLYAYAVMSNHYHLVVRIRAQAAEQWMDREVAERWLQLFKGPYIMQRWMAGDEMGEGELQVIARFVSTWRERLGNLSWFMRCLNESIARMANREDRCSGRFWEGRFTSQALLDERALLACMAYVDLNPIRAGMAESPEQSEYTSIQERIQNPTSALLTPFANEGKNHTVPFAYADYLQLVDWSGRAICSGKTGFIPPHAPPILERLGMDEATVLDFVAQESGYGGQALGPVSQLRTMARRAGLKFLKGISLGRRLCPEYS